MGNHVTCFAHRSTSGAVVVVFVDVDEKFLSDRSIEDSSYADDVLASERIAVVLCSSMTRAQLEVAQQKLGIREPFICESGAAIVIPNHYFSFHVPHDRELPGYHVIELGKPYTEVVARLRRSAERVNTPVVGFSDETVEQVALERGLTLSHARLAKLREYDEPFRLVQPSRSAHERLWKALRASGLACIPCGAAEHVGAPVNIVATANLLANLYRRAGDSIIIGTRESTALPPVCVPWLSASSAQPNGDATRMYCAVDRARWLETIVRVAAAARHRESGLQGH